MFDGKEYLIEIRRISVEIIHGVRIVRVLSGVSQRPEQKCLDFDDTRASATGDTCLPRMSISKYSDSDLVQVQVLLRYRGLAHVPSRVMMIRNGQSTPASPSRCLGHTRETEKIVLYKLGTIASRQQCGREPVEMNSIHAYPRHCSVDRN